VQIAVEAPANLDPGDGAHTKARGIKLEQAARAGTGRAAATWRGNE